MLNTTKKSLLAIIAILIFSTNLRAPFTAVGPLLDTIREALHITSTQVGTLITIPLLVFCFASPLASMSAKKWGLEKVLFVALISLILGICLRSSGITAFLFIGTAIIGLGIAIGSTLLPSLLKRDFPHQVAVLTSVYAITMGISSATGSAIVIPLTKTFNWNIALLSFIVLPVISALIWLPQLKTPSHQLNTIQSQSSVAIWKFGLAWIISLFLGLVSLVYYTITAWLPSIIVELGFTPAQAGNLHGLMQLATAVSGIAILIAVKKMKDQCAISLIMATLTLIGLLGLIVAPRLATLWVLVFGFGIGGAFILGLTFLGLRASSSQQAASLSGMAQCCGYLMASTGPVLAGMLHDYNHNWRALIDIMILLCVFMGAFGMIAGRNRQIQTQTS